MEAKHPLARVLWGGEGPWHCGPINTALPREVTTDLPSPLLEAGTTNFFGIGWTGSWWGPTPCSAAAAGRVRVFLCYASGMDKPRWPTLALQMLEGGEPRGSAAVDSMSCLILKLFQASEDPWIERNHPPLEHSHFCSWKGQMFNTIQQCNTTVETLSEECCIHLKLKREIRDTI